MAIDPNNGVLDIINGTLKVSSIDIKQAGGFTTAINTVARNDVLLYDDQDANTTFTPTQNAGYSSSSGVTRDTTAIDFNDGWVYWPLQLPNSWHTEFDILIPTTGGVLTYSLFNTSEPNHTDYTANDGGYKIVFDNTQNQIDIRWEGSVHATTSANVRSADWQHVNINYFQGAVSISLAGKVVLTHKFTENYQEFDSRYVGFSATSGASHKIRHLIVHNSDKWLYTKTSHASDISYVSGNVGIGTLEPTELLDVHGNVHIAKDLTVDGNLTVSGTTTFIDTQNLAVEDPIIEVARGNASDTIDAGLVITRASSNVAVAYRGDEEELALGYTQSGASDADVTPIADGGLDVRVYGNLFANNLTTTANVEATYLKGNGSEITHVTLDQVVDYGNTTANTIHLTNTDVGLKADGNVEANYFIGNGSQLDGISSTLQEITDNGNVTTNTIQFTNTTTALVADSNVGIGTDAPSANLHVAGHQYVNGPPTLTNSFDHSDAPLTLTHGTPTSTTAIDDPKPVLHLTRDGTSGQAYGARASFNLSRYENSGTASRSRLDVALTDGTYAESNVMSIRADGRVGIGTTAPGYTLDVNGDINLSGDFYQGGSLFVSSEWTTGSESLYYRSNVEIGTANLFVDTATSNVGVGTNTPAYKLDVHGTANVGAVTLNSNVYAPNLPLAEVASNLVTWNSSTGDLMDSGGLISNKLAIVSEQPPVALTGDSTVVDGHGTYKVTSSSEGNEPNYGDWNCFNKATGGNNAWHTDQNYNLATGAHNNSGVTLGGVQGEWVKLELPYKTILRHIVLNARDSSVANRAPVDFTLLGSNDDSTWTSLLSINGESYTAEENHTFAVNASAYYKYYALVVEKIGVTSQGNCVLGEWRLFTESFAIDGGKVAMASAAITGGNTVVDQTGPHARASPPLRKYPEIVFTEGEFDTTANGTESTYWAGPSTVFQGGYSLKTSHHSTGDGGSFGWEAFDGNEETFWKNPTDYESSTGNYDYGNTGVQSRLTDTSSTNHDGDHVIMGSPNKLKIAKVVVTCKAAIRRVVNYSVLGSNSTGTTGWTLLNSGTFNAQDVNTATITSPTSYFKYHAFVVRSVTPGADGQRFQINSIDFYGYEEDPPAGDTSVDTIITSQFNLPDTTGMKLYLDGDKGSTPTDYSGEGHTLTDNSETFSGNAWSFSSLATSNVTMTSGDLAMEGTHPHSVSLWFNAANVSSNATLFHVGTEAGEGDAKTSISLTESGHLGWIDGGDNQFLSANTWHNLVYTTQGGGGVRTCYLDGRKLGDVSVQDTFGDYPPFAMTGYSDRGYTVSSSGYNDSSGDRRVWLMFNNSTTDFYSFGPHYNSSTGDYTRSPASKLATTDIDGNSIPDGEFLKLEVPHKLLLQYITMIARTGQTVAAPRLWRMYGSNDDTNWKLLRNKTASTVPADTAGTNYTINASKGYKYFALVVTQNGGYAYCNIAELKYYGHKENDTTRFPVSSTVLKYPHIAMTGYGQRGYVASASSDYLVDSNAIRPAWGAYNSGVNYNASSTGAVWMTNFNAYSSSSPYAAIGGDTFTDSNGGTHTGHWNKIEMPRKLVPSSVYFTNGGTYSSTRMATVWVILGSNDDSTWDLLLSSTTTINQSTQSFAISTSTGYKYLMFLCKNTNGDSALVVEQIGYYGTEPEDVIARVGEGLDGKVANFRVYDKYLHEEQALELWDAQKDQFGVATSSVVVHKGRLGVGTTEPEGRFAVLDEPGDVEEFPPRALKGKYYVASSYDSSIPENSVHVEGHGIFTATASSHYGDPTDSGHVANYAGLYGPIKAFDRESSGTNYWYTHNNSTYTSGTGEYTGTQSLGGVSGEWIKLEKPYKTILRRFSILSYESYLSRVFKDFVVLGSNDDENWETLETFSGTVYTAYIPKYFNIVTTKAFKYYGFVCTNNGTGGASTQIKELRLFGTRQGQSTLHDGELKLTKNLTVPRIGPPLDADDTPRRDRLVVEYNTSTNPTENGMVRDTSSSGQGGFMYNDAYYDATEKALVFDGTDDYVSMSDWKYDTGFVHSFSGWIKFKLPEESWNVVYGVGNTAGTSRTNFTIWSKTNDSYFRTEADGSGSYIDHTFEFTGNMNKWLHMAVVKSSARIDSTRIYINGVLLPQTGATLADREVALPSTPQNFNLNGYGPDGTGTGNVNLSNVKFYDVALTADEVKRLYDMGRYDEGHHVVNFSKTRVGIGLGDEEAPRADLDVRGPVTSNLQSYYTQQTRTVPSKFAN
jgi:hypothetical protein